MKPMYNLCVEKGIQHAAAHATEAALGTKKSSRNQNGKVKKS